MSEVPVCSVCCNRHWPEQQHLFGAAQFHPVPPPIYPRLDQVNHPKHYTAHPSGVECITITEHMTFNVGNAVKYLWRADLKNGLEDLEKAAWYVNREIERRKKANA